MLLRARLNPLRAASTLSNKNILAHGFASTSTLLDNHNIREPIPLDPGLKSLLQDVDMTLMHHKHKSGEYRVTEKPKRELEPWPVTEDQEHELASSTTDYDEGAMEWDGEEESARESRKSPAALFGSQQIGAVELPHELQDAIKALIADADRPRLHEDAKRLFLNPGGSSNGGMTWDTTYDIKYKSRKQQHHHAERDGTAFASVALPSHFSAIYAVLENLKLRLGPEWNVDRVIDWTAGTGSGFWASAYAFQKPFTTPTPEHGDNYAVANSKLAKYIGIEDRTGLVMIGKRLMENVQEANVKAKWQKSFHEEDKLPREKGKETIALSAFALSALPTPLARKAMVKEMWESGADVIVIIDHNTKSGFENVAEARENLLRMGRREFEDPEVPDSDIQGSHVVAPCPHDGACPLYVAGTSNKLVCGFSQRMQRPAFVRHTKHSGIGHEDVGYSYVVVRRGQRPTYPIGQPRLGRVGAIGYEAEQKQIEKDQNQRRELKLHVEENSVSSSSSSTSTTAESPVKEAGELAPSSSADVTKGKDEDGLIDALRLESYAWPRLVFPPLKRSGHIILDVCAPSGKILRQTIPKSQGKQPYYDARKSSWGDIFPHEPKNKPQERHLSTKSIPGTGQDIGKRSGRKAKAQGFSSLDATAATYAKIAKEAKEAQKQARRERKRLVRESEDREI